MSQEELEIDDISQDDWSLYQKEVVEEKKDTSEDSKHTASKENSRNFNTNINKKYLGKEINWLGVPVGSEVVFRPLGLPYSVRTKPWHPKKIFTFDMLSDSNKMLPIICPHVKNAEGVDQNVLDEDWFLRKVINKVFSKHWDDQKIRPSDNSNGWWNYHYESTEIYHRFLENRPHHTFDTSSLQKYVSERVVMNVISRMDDINFKTKKTSILTPSFKIRKNADKHGKVDKEGNPIIYEEYTFSYGVSETFYNQLLATSVDIMGHWDLDHIVKTTKANEKTNLPAYNMSTSADIGLSQKIQLLLGKRPEIQNKTIIVKGKEIIQQIVNRVPLTEEEKKLAPNSLDAIFVPTSYQDIFDNYEDVIKLCDSDLSTNFLEELKSLVKQEGGSIVTVSPKRTFMKKEESKAPEAPVAPVAPEVLVEEQSLLPEMSMEEIKAKCKEVYESWDDLGEEDQKKMLSNISSFDNGIPVLKEPKRFLKCSCSRKYKKDDGTMSSVNVSGHEHAEKCAMCGIEF